jgi:fatty-acyl-CoA synthase
MPGPAGTDRRSLQPAAHHLDTARKAASTAVVLRRAGVLGPVGPGRLVRVALALRRYGATMAGAYAVQSAWQPDRAAVIDPLGTLSFAQMEARTTALAAGLAGIGIGPDHRVGLLCRNHRGFVEATVALARLGADTLYLNTGFAGPQLADVLTHEGASAVILDEEFSGLTPLLPPSWPRVLASPAAEADTPLTLPRLMLAGLGRPLRRPPHDGRLIILTSGTTGAPRGTRRQAPASVDPLLAVLSTIPLRRSDTTLIAAPMFHTWGLAHLGLGLVLGTTLVLPGRFEPEPTLALIEEHRVTALAAVPVMLQRILDLPEPVRRRYDISSLRVVAVSGSALSGDLAARFMDAFGDVLYNLYGSTEVAWATVATPEDLRAAPGTAGRPPVGTVVRLVDADDRPVAVGERGRIFVGNSMLFGGYTDGSTKQVLDGLMATGDVGHLDGAGRLFVEGRDDDMIVSGGENVFPGEVEDLIAAHPAVLEAAVIGVPDAEFGQRLKAFVVERPGHALSADEVRAFVRDRLARYKVPRDVEFVDGLPRNATGKVLRRALPA